jgi:hypothetical protein
MDKEKVEALCSKVAREIFLYLRKFRVPVRDCKEKYGTVRVYTGLGWTSIHSIFYPGYVYSQFPQWLWTFDVYYGDKLLYYSGLSWLSYKVHAWAYRKAYKNAIDKYPEIRDNILNSADYKELLKEL